MANIMYFLIFKNKINCEVYVQQNYTTLMNGLQIYLDQQGDSGVVENIGCTALSKKDLEKMFEEQKNWRIWRNEELKN